MSNQPANDPWAKFYRERGRARPPLTQLTGRKPPRPRDAPPPTRARTEEMQRWHALAELARAAAAPAPPRAREEPGAGRALRRWFGWTLGGLAAAIVCFEAARFIFADAPAAAQLEATAQAAARRVLAQWRSPATPWGLEDARAEPVWREGSGTRHYDAVVTLRLEAALYAPAVSNGTEGYRLLQRSLADARTAARRHGLDVAVPALQAAPELPELLDVTAKEGEKLVVRVPFTARRGVWRWENGAPEWRLARANRRIGGQALAAWEKGSFLRFDTAAERAAMRERMRQAREFVLTTNRELQARGLPPANRPVDGVRP